MPTPTYTPLANITLTGTAASVTFSSISQAYKDLVLVCAGNTSANLYPRIRFNSDTGANYSYIYAAGDGSVTGSAGSASVAFIQIGSYAFWNATDLANSTIYVMDYSATDKHKSALVRSNSPKTGAGVDMTAGRWANTAAVTTVTFSLASGTFSAGSTFALYGIAA